MPWRVAGGQRAQGWQKQRASTNLQMRKLTRSESRNSLMTMALVPGVGGGRARQQVAAVSRLVVAGESAGVEQR